MIDHEARDRLRGLLSVIGVKYTTARRAAERAVDLAFRKLGYQPPPCRAKQRVLPGAQDLVGSADLAGLVPDDEPARTLFYRYGGNYKRVLEAVKSDRDGGVDPVFCARSRYAVTREMAVRLQDVVLRRTEHARQGELNEGMLRWCARMMSSELDWSESRQREELADALEQLRLHGAKAPGPSAS